MSANTVDEVSAAMANTTISDSTNAPADQNKSTDATDNSNNNNNDAGLVSAAEGRRLYIGNLAYATTEGELKEFFKDFSVESTSIPTNPRTTRPVGYAFVDLSTPAEAERAINELSGKEILQRKVSVQLARKHEPAGEKGEGGATSGGEAGSGGEGEGKRFGGRGRYRGRGRGGRYRGGRFQRNNRNRQTENTDNAQNGGAEGTTNEEPTNVPGQVTPLTEKTNEAQPAEDRNQGTTSGKPRGFGQRKQRGPPEDGIESKTKVMVANLPYDLHEDKLKELFKDYEPVAAKIALRPIPRFMVRKLQARNEPRKGRGFGFVTLSTEEMQQKAIGEMNGKEIEGREIVVKVAIDSPGKEDNDGNGAADDAAGETAGNEENTEQNTEQTATS
jgi:RNA recognition motif-containing protein